MTDDHPTPSHVITVPSGTPVYVLPIVVDGQEMEQYVFGEGALDSIPIVHDDTDVRSLFGVWSDLDWEEVERELYRLRHDSDPASLTNFSSDNGQRGLPK